MTVYINGSFFPEEDAKISVFDHSFLYGDGVYETMRAYGGRVFKLDEHTARLFRSASMIELSPPLDENGLMKAVSDTVRENGLLDATIRVTLSRGTGETGLDPALCPDPTLVIMAKQFRPYPDEMYNNGVKVSVVAVRRNHPECLDPAIKSNNFLNNIIAKMQSKKAGAFEGVMLNHGSYVAEGTISNIFIVKAGELHTPPLMAGILDGITRNVVIGLAEGMGVPVSEEIFTEAQLWQADEVFLTNTSMEVMPVTRVDEHVIAGGSPGGLTSRLRKEFAAEVERCLTTH